MITEHLPDNWTLEQRGTRTYIFDPDGKPRCGAITSKKTPCMKYPVKGHCRCRTHGANNKAGKGNGNYKTGEHVGRYTMPDSLVERYDEMLTDPEFLNLRQNIGIIDSRLQLLLNKIQNADFGEAVLPQLNRLYYRAERHLRNRDMEEFASLWVDMGQLIRQGQQDYLTWQEIIDVNEARGKMVKRTVDIELAAHRAASLNEVLYIMRRIVEIFENSNSESDELQRRELFVSGLRLLLNESSDS